MARRNEGAYSTEICNRGATKPAAPPRRTTPRDIFKTHTFFLRYAHLRVFALNFLVSSCLRVRPAICPSIPPTKSYQTNPFLNCQKPNVYNANPQNATSENRKTNPFLQPPAPPARRPPGFRIPAIRLACRPMASRFCRPCAPYAMPAS